MTGTYGSPELTLELAADGSGAIVFQGARMPIRAVVRGNELQGVFHADGNEFPFSGRLDGDRLLLESGGASYVLTRRPPAVNPLAAAKAPNPLAARPPAPAPAPPAPPAPAPPAPAPAPAPEDGGQIYRHPTGCELRIPPGWSAQPSAAGVQLVPPSAAFGPTGPAEVYLVSAQPAPGIDDAGDARVVAYLDQSLAQMIPGADRAGGPERFGAGVRLRWSGQNAMTGQPLQVVSMVTILRGVAIGVTAFAEPARVASRLPALETVFHSLRWGQGDLDPALVGVWHFWSYSGGASMSAETRRVYELGPDGGARMTSSTETSASLQGRDGHGDTAWTAGYAGQGGDERSGTWSAGGGALYIIWEDGSTSTWQYRVLGDPGDRRVMLQSPGEKPLEWRERPIQV